MTPDEQRAEDRKADRHVILFLEDRKRLKWQRHWRSYMCLRRKNHYAHHWKAKRGKR